jgi:hypothetical protein
LGERQECADQKEFPMSPQAAQPYRALRRGSGLRAWGVRLQPATVEFRQQTLSRLQHYRLRLL